MLTVAVRGRTGLGCPPRKQIAGNTSRLSTSSADVAALDEVVERTTARALICLAFREDHVDDLHVLRSAATWHRPVAPSTVPLANAPWMDWSDLSGPQSASFKELGSMMTDRIAATGYVSESSQIDLVDLEV